MDYKIILSVVLCALSPLQCLAAPDVSNSIGTISDGQSITISGSGFGSTGPNVVLFDNFTGTSGDVIPLTGAQVGAWTARGGYNATYEADGTNTAALFVNALEQRQLVTTFSGVTNVFVSYKVKIPTGYHFPNSSAPGAFCPDSCWKLAWLMDNGQSTDDDFCTPTHSWDDEWSISGNDAGITYPLGTVNKPKVGNDVGSGRWFSFSGWNRMSTWIKGGANPITDLGKIWFQAVNSEYGNRSYYFDRYVFDGDDETLDDAIQEIDTFKIPGWYRVAGANSAYDSMTRAIYDDVYLATGANAAARVEIGNASTYSACTRLAIATPTNWSATSIVATVRSGDFSSGEYVYLFVVDADNTPSVGYGPLQIGGSGGATGRYYRARVSE